MAIVYRIVEEHGGRLKVDTEPGSGPLILRIETAAIAALTCLLLRQPNWPANRPPAAEPGP